MAKRKNILFPVPTISLEKVHPCFSITKFGYSRECEVVMVNRTKNLAGTTNDMESWILAVLAKHSRFIFEFGTCSGRSTYLMARNSPDDTRIVTLTLDPYQSDVYVSAAGDLPGAMTAALNESIYKEFVYTGTEVEKKITQLYGDSKKLDETPYIAKCDLIFIDGSHAYSYVKNDTEKALRMLRPGGIILWHDYASHRTTADVFRYLNELRHHMRIGLIEDTTLVAYSSGQYQT